MISCKQFRTNLHNYFRTITFNRKTGPKRV